MPGRQAFGMNQRRTVFAQVMEAIHREQFQRCVSRYRGDYKVRRFFCRDDLRLAGSISACLATPIRLASAETRGTGTDHRRRAMGDESTSHESDVTII